MARFLDSVRADNTAALDRIRARIDGVSEARLRVAGNRAIASVRRKFEPAAKHAIRDVYNVPLNQLTGRFQVKSGSDASSEYLSLQASTQGTPLLGFGARWGGRNTPGATAQVLRGQGKTYVSAFIASIRGKRYVLARQFSADSNSPSGRDPRNKLRRLMGPTTEQMTHGYGEANAKRIAGEMTSFLSSEIKRQLELARTQR